MTYVPHTTPYAHQLKAYELGRDRRYFGYIMDMGTGKTKVALDDAAYNFDAGRIDAVLVTAPNGVHRNWAGIEIPKHIPHVQTLVHCYESAKTSTQRHQRAMEACLKPNPGTLVILCMNVEAFSCDTGRQAAKKFLRAHRCLWILDESSRIKHPGTKRTRAMTAMSVDSAGRRILTGTPITQGPLDIYAQAKFLSPKILGFDTFAAFKNYYAVWQPVFNGGIRHDELVAYRNLDEMATRLGQHTFRVEKKDCLDLPPKVYTTLPVILGAEQQKLYSQITDDLAIELENGEKIDSPNALVKLLHLQQITGGFMPGDDGVFNKPLGANPKLTALMDFVQDLQGKAVIWCRFRAEVAAVVAALKLEFGEKSVVEYHGGISNDDRVAGINEFQNGDARWFVGTPASGGIGITLTAAQTQIFFSNDFNLETRLQAEDRSHRIGTVGSVLYVDIEAQGTIDQAVVGALKSKKNVAETIVTQIKNARGN